VFGRSRLIRGAGLAAALAGGALSLAGCGGNKPAVSGTAASSNPPVAAQSSAALEQQFVAVVKETQPVVAQIQTDQGLGSGVIFDSKGDVVTNAHVVAGAGAMRVTLADGRQFSARLVGSYAPDDIAVVSVGAGHNLTSAHLADSSKVEVGDIVLATGNPLGLQSSVTDGIVSAIGRTVSEGGSVVLPNSIQTSAPINPGNSGGALVNLQGEVIGIPTLAAGNPQAGGAAAGIGFAIPSNLVRDIAGQLVRYGRVVNSHRAALGVRLADNLGRPGALIAAVQSGGPADKAGIVEGDSIDALNGRTVTSSDDLATILATLEPGRRVGVTVIRQDGSRSTVTVTLGSLTGG
jgi:putative serine protease PepD